MSRQRLTSKVAEEIAGDVYTMNNPEHEKNDPKIDEYANGNPSSWAEDPAKGDSPKGDGASRAKNTPNSSKEAAEAVKTARKLEQKAVKCIVAAQRMLPGAADEIIEAQAADLMELPEGSLNSTLSRQEKLAQSVIAKAEEVVEEVEEKEEKTAMTDEEKKAFADKMQAARAKKAAADKELEELEKSASDDKDKDKDKDKDDEEVVEASDAKEEEKEEVVEASDAKEEEKEEEKEEGTGKDASLLDEIFSSVEASDNKKGASSLSGMVKKEASAKDDLAKLWGNTPDVSHVFN